MIRVFPRKTSATPTDKLVRFSTPEMFDETDEIHISVTFTYDLKHAEWLEKNWRHVAPTKMGGPALNDLGGEFVPGRYLKQGYTITSRGCPNKCWFCSVWKREGNIRELEIKDGYDVLDSNLLACSDDHIKKVFDMLSRQKERPRFTGGLEPKRMKSWIAKELKKLKPSACFFAYDTPDDYEPLRECSQILKEVELLKTHHEYCCYVLCGFHNDTMDLAEKRLKQVFELGFLPFAMVYRDKMGEITKEWARWARLWIRPWVVMARLRGESR
jgi:hypothetical protein